MLLKAIVTSALACKGQNANKWNMKARPCVEKESFWWCSRLIHPENGRYCVLKYEINEFWFIFLITEIQRCSERKQRKLLINKRRSHVCHTNNSKSLLFKPYSGGYFKLFVQLWNLYKILSKMGISTLTVEMSSLLCFLLKCYRRCGRFCSGGLL